jgi:phosphorylase/glycogen(starch) synthase
MKYVFEVSWEVCNKVGGIHTVIATKAQEAINHFGEGYITIGPDINENNHEFKELSDSFSEQVKIQLEEVGLKCRFGRWNIQGSPRVILISGFKERFNIERLLHSYWEEFGVDSYGGGWDYIEPVLFSTAAAEVIEQIVNLKFSHEDYGLAHFHEWMCGAGILYLKKNLPRVGTVFTTHATMLGRAMAHHNQFYYKEIEDRYSNASRAHQFGVQSKHSMEKLSAINADCFTTVSEITSSEAFYVLGKKADLIVYNGMNVDQKFSPDTKEREKNKKIILEKCSEFFDEKLPADTKIIISSGRYEYKNKGYDISLEALSRLQNTKGNEMPNVLFLFLIAADNIELENYKLPSSQNPNFRAIAISPVYNKDHDPIVNAAKHFGLDKRNSKVRVALSTAYLNGREGIFNIPYEEMLKSADLTLFPSYYEPWGYTPMESVVEGIPTVTSDLAGFGYWSQIQNFDSDYMIKVLTRKNKSYEEALENLSTLIFNQLTISKNKNKALEQTEAIREAISWKTIFQGYLTAYDIAFGKSQHRRLNFEGSLVSANPFSGTSCSIQPGSLDVRCFNVHKVLPTNISMLNDIVHNLWWTWDDSAQALLKSINPDLWEYFHHNPVLMLKNIPAPELEKLNQNQEFCSKLAEVHARFTSYVRGNSIDSLIDLNRPSIAYLSMEFGIHECLKTYSGGLGILAGDHLKAASDLNINLIGVGLFYKRGYFIQEINQDGYQIEHNPIQDWRDLPMDLLLNHSGEPVKIPVEFSDRIVWTRVFLARVGRIPLFMFDTDIEHNHPDDREITANLYVSDRETRIKQEFLIGVASARLLKDVLGLNPSIYHLNEGHCAFLSAELIRRYAQQGYSFEAAVKAVKDSTIFTTHTPVPAGNEAFSRSLVTKTFHRFFENMHYPLEQFMNLGLNPDKPDEFSMTVLAFNVSKKANAVSKLHEEVSREMWANILPKEDKYFGSVTNGVHMPTWQARNIRKLISGDFFEEGYNLNQEKINQIADDKIWEAHQSHKQELINYLEKHVKSEFLRRGLAIDKIKLFLDALSKDVLLVGFARRFAPYKRANLLLRDLNRLEKIVNNSKKPVVFVFAGKSHPADGRGKEIIQEIYRMVEDERFLGKILVLENYDMETGRLLTNGCDIWLNNPYMGKEACGTSGMKAAASGVINFSIPDGWVFEVPIEDIGWKIEPSNSQDDETILNEESNIIYQMFENEITNTYYAKNSQGYSPAWVDRMKKSITYVAKNFSARRMLEDYNIKLYMSVIRKGLEKVSGPVAK